ncbi:MAG: hypothetical protein RL090_255 [Bacteroidota bacterium]
MKKTIVLIILVFATTNMFGQFLQGVSITPQNPDSNDSIRVIATGFLPSSGCNDKTITISQQGSQINIDALHCMGLLTTICNVSDTVFLPPFPAGTYTLNFTLAGGLLPAPCVASGQSASNTISFNVSSAGQPANDNALDFDGVDDFVSVPNASNLIAGSGNISMSMWVYPKNTFPSYPDFDGFGGFRDDFAGDFYLLQLSGTDVEARLRNSTGTPYTMVYSGLQLNTWQHFVLTYDGSTMALYHNGTQVISTPANGVISNTVNPFYIGKAPFTNAPFNLNGKVDEISLWNKTLSQQEIDCIYTSGINPTSTNLQLYYKCNQGIAGGNNTSVASLTDATGHINGLFDSMTLNGNTSNFVQGVTTSSTTINAVLCPGTSYQFGGQTITTAGTYFETFTGSSGCDSVVQLILTSPTFNLAVSQSGATLISQQPNGPYQWINCTTGAPVAGATGQFFTATANGQYAVVLSQGGCNDTSVCVTVTGINTGLWEHIEQNISVSPMPFDDQLTITLQPGPPTKLYISDLSGRIVLNELEISGGESRSVSTEQIASGVYLLQSADGRIRMKLIRR